VKKTGNINVATTPEMLISLEIRQTALKFQQQISDHNHAV